jgi:uncharacterized membrane protein
MQDADLLMGLAGIAGVFVGFGALIAVRGGGVSEPGEISPVRVTVGMGVMAVIGALAPVTLGRYDLDDHQVLALSSILVLAGTLGIAFMHVRSPEFKAYATARELRPSDAVGLVAWVALAGGMVLVPIAVVLGVAPDLESALYFTVLVLILLMAAWSLLSLVFAQRSPSVAADPAALPTAGGTSA